MFWCIYRDQVLRITAKDEAQISLLKELSEQEHLGVSFISKPIYLFMFLKCIWHINIVLCEHLIYLFLCVQLNFWREPVQESLPVDVHVPFHSLQAVRAFLGYNQIQYNVMIKDVQVGLLIQLFDCYDCNSLERIIIRHTFFGHTRKLFCQSDPFWSKIFPWGTPWDFKLMFQ